MTTSLQRLKVVVHGAVQGVGFRPFVYRLATELGLNGWVRNNAQGVFIEVEGAHEVLEQFLLRLGKDKPLRAVIFGMESSYLEPVSHDHFEILESESTGTKTAVILPDIATCRDCLQEILDPRDRRHLYPFTNCTNCGPRFSIIESLPYDRPHTSMHEFQMCARCEAEYRDPRNRRFHAQPNACPNCGPQLALWDANGDVLAERHDAILGAAAALRAGRIIALKGIGGFQLIVDARNEGAMRRLRTRKNREEKPFALMYPYLDAVTADCVISPTEERLLFSPECPIVLLNRKSPARARPIALVDSVIAPRNPYLGVMLPYSPLHHLLMRELGFPIVATSGNLSDDPICIDEYEALDRLHEIADLFLVHNRRIVRHVDDSVVRVMLGREQVLRRARGYAPLPIHVKKDLPNVLAVGAHLKNAVALSTGREIFISQHIGDLETQPAYNAFRRVCTDLQDLYEVAPDVIACDMHPDYLSTKFARSLNVPIAWVQHHYAHVISCMAENELEAPVLGVSWDGTGYATDGTIWGGEFLQINETSFHRAAHFRSFKLPGGEMAIKQPRRCALGVLHEIFGDKLFDKQHQGFWKQFGEGEIPLLRQMLAKGINSPTTTSAGRLFDAVASLINLRQELGFEGQAAMELEFCATPNVEGAYPFAVREGSPGIVDWEPMIRAILADVEEGKSQGIIAAQFHNTLASIIVAVAQRLKEPKVVLTGGCFQNRYLTERTVRLLEAEGLHAFWHQRVPPNDGGIALGQAIAAVRASTHAFNSTEALTL